MTPSFAAEYVQNGPKGWSYLSKFDLNRDLQNGILEIRTAPGMLGKDKPYPMPMPRTITSTPIRDPLRVAPRILLVDDISVLLVDIMAIADEVDSELAQAMASYIAEAKSDARPVEA
jgi:hypothetical protein